MNGKTSFLGSGSSGLGTYGSIVDVFWEEFVVV
jgi:hypothetical protein